MSNTDKTGPAFFWLSILAIFFFGNVIVKGLVLILLGWLLYKWLNRLDIIPDPPLRKADDMEEFYWTNSKSQRLYGRIHIPLPEDPNNIKGIIFYYHGLNNWSDRPVVIELGQRAAAKGFYFVTYDQQGFGRSAPGTNQILGCIKDWKTLISDGHEIMDYIYKTYPSHNLQSRPAFIIGLSMGGTVSLHLQATRHNHPELWKNVKGLALLAPGIMDNLTPAPFFLFLLRIITWLGGSWLPLGPPGRKLGWSVKTPHLKPEQWPIRGPKCLESYREYLASPLTIYPRRMILSTGTQLIGLTKEVKKILHKVDIPFLIVHGTGDAVIPLEGSRLLVASAQSTDKTLKEYTDACHCLYDDPLWFEIEKDIWEWIENRL